MYTSHWFSVISGFCIALSPRLASAATVALVLSTSQIFEQCRLSTSPFSISSQMASGGRFLICDCTTATVRTLKTRYAKSTKSDRHVLSPACFFEYPRFSHMVSDGARAALGLILWPSKTHTSSAAAAAVPFLFIRTSSSLFTTRSMQSNLLCSSSNTTHALTTVYPSLARASIVALVSLTDSAVLAMRSRSLSGLKSSGRNFLRTPILAFPALPATLPALPAVFLTALTAVFFAAFFARFAIEAARWDMDSFFACTSLSASS